MNPFDLFSDWYRSICSPSPDKMVLSTCDDAGVPSSRIVLLKKYNESGFIFFTNCSSRKIQEIEKNNNVSLLFSDSKLRVISICGSVEKIDTEISDQYFATRSREKQIASWSSKQSKLLHSEQKLQEMVEFYTKKFMHKKVVRPTFWSGFRVIPDKFEFIQDKKVIKCFYRSLNNTWMC